MYTANVATHGEARWDLIAPHFLGRTRKTCSSALAKIKVAKAAEAKGALAARARASSTARAARPGPATRPTSSTAAQVSQPQEFSGTGSAHGQPVSGVLDGAIAERDPAVVPRAPAGVAFAQALPAPAASVPVPAPVSALLPVAQPAPAAKLDPAAWTEDEIEELLDAARRLSDPVKASNGEWDEVREIIGDGTRTRMQCFAQFRKLVKAGKWVAQA